MLALAVTLALLMVPAGHQVVGHRVHRKFFRAVRGHSPEVQPTEHERRHGQRPPRQRLAVNLAWLGYLAVVLAAGLVLR